MMLQILLDHFFCHWTYRGAKIASRPKMSAPIPLRFFNNGISSNSFLGKGARGNIFYISPAPFFLFFAFFCFLHCNSQPPSWYKSKVGAIRKSTHCRRRKMSGILEGTLPVEIAAEGGKVVLKQRRTGHHAGSGSGRKAPDPTSGVYRTDHGRSGQGVIPDRQPNNNTPPLEQPMIIQNSFCCGQPDARPCKPGYCSLQQGCVP